MIQIVGASSLKRLFEFCQSNKLDLRKHITAISGLSLNPHAKSKLKNLKFLCTQGYLHPKKLLIWHDIINNSLNAHRSNNFRANTVSNLCTTLLQLKNHITAIVYCQRGGLPNIYEELTNTGILVLHVQKHLLSPRKKKNCSVLKEFASLHPSRSVELNILITLWRYQYQLSALLKTRRSQKKKPSKKNRRSQQNKRSAVL